MSFTTTILFILSFLNFIILGTGSLQVVTESNNNLVYQTSKYHSENNSPQIYQTNSGIKNNSDMVILNLKEPDEISLSKTLRSSSFKEIIFNLISINHTFKVLRKFTLFSESKHLLHQTFRL